MSSEVVSTVQPFRQAWNDEVALNLLGFNFPRARHAFLNCAETKDLLNFATAERRLFVLLSRYSEACWINSAIPDGLSKSSFRHISSMVIDGWTSEQTFMGALGNLPGVGIQVILGGSDTSELNELAGRLLPVKSLNPSRGNLRKLYIGANDGGPQMDVSLVGSYHLHGLKSLTLHGSAIVGRLVNLLRSQRAYSNALILSRPSGTKTGPFEVFTSLLALQELEIGGTTVDCSRALEFISSAPWVSQIKQLGLSETNVQGDIAALGNCTNLEKADFERCYNITGDIAALGKCTNLVTANFYRCSSITGDIAVLGSCTNLVSVELSPGLGNFAKITGDIAALGNCTNLENADFKYCTGITGDIAALGNCTNLENADFNFCSGITGDIAALGNCTNLETANFFDCKNITGDIAALGNCTNLENANFYNCPKITGDIAALGNCTNLVTAKFVSCSGITGDIAALGNCTNLEYADFTSCEKITGDIAALANCTNLEKADFSNCARITGTFTGALLRMIVNRIVLWSN